MPLRHLLIAASLFASIGGASASPRAVIELFTSQGCASCPPADALLQELGARDDIITLSMPVTLWDYLGWTDTLALPELTHRQKSYARARGDQAVYTPQVVINGRIDAVGSNQSAILNAIGAHNASGPALPVPVTLEQSGDVLPVHLGAVEGLPYKRATVWIAFFDRDVTVRIRRGENRGRSITYHNVVQQMRPIGMWKNVPHTIELPLMDQEWDPADGCAVLVQLDLQSGPGPIIGAASLSEFADSANEVPLVAGR